MNPPPDPVPLFGPEMLADPYPLYHQLRGVDPVYRSQRHNAWIVTGYDAVAAGLLDLRLSSDRARLFQELAGGTEFAPFFSFVSKRMVYTDPPLTRVEFLFEQSVFAACGITAC
jgi:cytochrome P450 PksS